MLACFGGAASAASKIQWQRLYLVDGRLVLGVAATEERDICIKYLAWFVCVRVRVCAYGGVSFELPVAAAAAAWLTSGEDG